MIPVEFIPSPNRGKRKKPDITAIVIHYTASLSMEGTLSWFKNPVSQVSAHYVIGRDGRIVQMVKLEERAWHAGRSSMFPVETYPNFTGNRETDVNQFSVGIELVGTMDSGFTDRQLASLYEVLAQLVSKYRVPPERVVGHLHVAPGRKIDPDGIDRQFPWAKAKQVCEAAYRPTLPPAGAPGALPGAVVPPTRPFSASTASAPPAPPLPAPPATPNGTESVS